MAELWMVRGYMVQSLPFNPEGTGKHGISGAW
jgi:hypothetical protein